MSIAQPAPRSWSRRLSRWLPWISGLILLAGLSTFLIMRYGDYSKTTPTVNTPFRPGKPSVVQQQQRSVPPSPAAKRVAARFILTAVRRRDLAESWNLVGPGLKGGMTKKEWLTGNIPVVPYLGELGPVPLKVDYSQRNEVQFEVALVPKNTSAKSLQQNFNYFIMVLDRYGKGRHSRWLVNYWLPRGENGHPSNPNN